jgi:hypothetical protein
MTRFHVIALMFSVACLVSSCVVSDDMEEGGITSTHEEFRLKYTDLSPSHFDAVRTAESLIAQGRTLHDEYFRLKTDKNRIDIELRRRALEILSRADQSVMKIYTETSANSVLALHTQVSSLYTSLLREYEQPIESPAPYTPK